MLITPSLTGLASVALLSTLFTSVAAAHDSLNAHQAYVDYLRRAPEQHVVAKSDGKVEVRHSNGGSLRSHGHKHIHKRAEGLEKRSTAAVVAPTVVATSYLGGSTNNPSEYYFQSLIAAPALPTFTSGSPYYTKVLSLAKPLATAFPIYNGTGAAVLTPENENQLFRLNTVPSLNRDSGKGGYVNGSKIFVFSDTETFTHPTAELVGAFTGFVSNSVAFDYGYNAADGQPISMRDGVGVWSNSNGGIRTWIPLTTGEKEWNAAMLNLGGRIAIWPSSSITPLSDGVAIQYAPIVMVNSSDGVQFHQVGITMYEITVPNHRSGPVAKRVAPYLFNGSPTPSWGVVGATRSWGSEGVGGTDGWVWAYAINSVGVMASRVPAGQAADATAYEYWWHSKGEWSTTMPMVTTETFVNGSYSGSDIFYSPMHKTFINVYEDRYIDNKILWRYLMVPEGGIVPAYDGTDFLLNMLNYPWSGEQTLFQAPTPENGMYIYSSGPNFGYFEDDDVFNGGNMMLLNWCSPTGKASDSVQTSYNIPAAVITWG